MNRHQSSAVKLVVTLLHIVVPGDSFFTPTTSYSLLLQQQSHHLRPCHNKVPSTHVRIDASDHDSPVNEDYSNEPELVLPSEIQRADSLKGAEESDRTIPVPNLIIDKRRSHHPSGEEEKSFAKTQSGIIVPVIDLFASLKKRLYAQIRDVLTGIISIITRSLTKTEDWVRDDATGQLVSSALALVSFFLAVALFAAWNIQVLGGKKWSGPAEVIVPTVRVPTSTFVEGGIKVKKAEWKRPTIQTSYKIQDGG